MAKQVVLLKSLVTGKTNLIYTGLYKVVSMDETQKKKIVSKGQEVVRKNIKEENFTWGGDVMPLLLSQNKINIKHLGEWTLSFPKSGSGCFSFFLSLFARKWKKQIK